MRLAISSIRLDGGTQTRAEIDLTVAADYADRFREGVQFPPVVVFYDGSTYWLSDGFHRVTGAKSAELDELDADVRQGTRRDAILFSVGANSAHGLRRTNADKRRAVETLLRDAVEWHSWPDNKIAKACGVSQPFVSKVRAEVASSNGLKMPETRTVERNGVTYQQNTANIGKGKPTPAPEQSPLAGVKASEMLDELAEDDAEDEPAPPVSRAPAPVSNVTPIRSAPVDTTAFDADARELRKILTEARNLASRLTEQGAGLGGAVRVGRLADVRRLVAEALRSLGEVKVAV